VKHGNRAASSRCGSADVLEALGVAIDLGPEGVSRCVAEAGVGFCFAPRYHPAMRHVAPVRRELGVATTFNVLGPLANPARVTRQAVGVADERMAARMLGALRELGSEHVLVFHGDDGLDELTTTTTSVVFELRDGSVSKFEVDPEDLGLARVGRDSLTGGDAALNASVVHRVLGGEPGPLRDIATLNAAAAFMVAGRADARTSIDEGRAARALDGFIRTSVAAREAGDN
jgi:anthranilate phosphoribosyltransferase